MTPERQKSRVYYRCQTSDCAIKTIREDCLDVAVQTALSALEIPKSLAAKLKCDWLAWINDDQKAKTIWLIDLRINQFSDWPKRLTDLLIDGSLDKSEFGDRKGSLAFELT